MGAVLRLAVFASTSLFTALVHGVLLAFSSKTRSGAWQWVPQSAARHRLARRRRVGDCTQPSRVRRAVPQEATNMALALHRLLPPMLLGFPLFGRQPSNDACTEEAGAPPQERMPADRTRKRQARFQRHVRRKQPQWEELLHTPSTYSRHPAGTAAPVTVILNHFKRHTLCRQIEALLHQSSGPPVHIWVCLFASPMAAAAIAAVKSYNDSRIAVFVSPYNFKYFGRFQLAVAAPSRHVLLFDDDMVPGRRYLETLLQAAGSSHGQGAVLGSIGWLLPRPRPAPDLRLASYRSLVNDTGGLCTRAQTAAQQHSSSAAAQQHHRHHVPGAGARVWAAAVRASVPHPCPQRPRALARCRPHPPPHPPPASPARSILLEQTCRT